MSGFARRMLVGVSGGLLALSVLAGISPAASATSDFISTWNTVLTSPGSSSPDQIALPLDDQGLYDFTVDWGDGSSSRITSYTQAERVHTYGAPGVYTIRISGLIEGWRFSNGGDKLKILNIERWGNLALGNRADYFWGAANLNATATDSPDLSGTTDLTGTFDSATSFNGDLSAWDVSGVEDMTDMFADARSFNRSLSSWDVSSVEDMGNMFYGATSFNQDLSSWDVSSVIDMSDMFDHATSFDQSLASWDIQTVENMDYMFDGVVLSTPNYDAMLTAWSALPNLQREVIFDGGGSRYSPNVAVARERLIEKWAWEITDGGPTAPLPTPTPPSGLRVKAKKKSVQAKWLADSQAVSYSARLKARDNDGKKVRETLTVTNPKVKFTVRAKPGSKVTVCVKSSTPAGESAARCKSTEAPD